MTFEIRQGDLRQLEILRDLPDSSYDALLCDAPYGLSPDGRAYTWDDLDALKIKKRRVGMMNKAWDAAVPGIMFWRECFRILKPGAPLLCFGGTRTFHRVACAIEDSGFEMIDSIAWLYGSGMPKSSNVSKYFDKAAGKTRKAIGPDPYKARRSVNVPKFNGTHFANGEIYQGSPDCPVTEDVTPEAKRYHGYGTRLKPCFEPIVFAIKPPDGIIIANIAKYDVGAINIDGCRIAYASDDDKNAMAAGVEAIRERGGVLEGSWKNSSDLGGANPANDAGRWPPNVCLDEAMAAELDEQAGNRPSTLAGRADPSAKHGNPGDNDGASWFGGGNSSVYADDGGPSRFMYVAKVSKRERDIGCEDLPIRSPGENVDREEGSIGIQNGRAGAGRHGGVRNHHPTLKPVSLTRWLATLVIPPPGRERKILVPFSGSGSEMIGCILAGWEHVLGIEQDAEFIQIAQRRCLAAVVSPGLYTSDTKPVAGEVLTGQVSLFGKVPA